MAEEAWIASGRSPDVHHLFYTSSSAFDQLQRTCALPRLSQDLSCWSSCHLTPRSGKSRRISKTSLFDTQQRPFAPFHVQNNLTTIRLHRHFFVLRSSEKLVVPSSRVKIFSKVPFHESMRIASTATIKHHIHNVILYLNPNLGTFAHSCLY